MPTAELKNSTFRQAFVERLDDWREDNAFGKILKLELIDLPFNGLINGQVSYLAPPHKRMLDNLVEKSRYHTVQVLKILGYASAPGTEPDNLALSQNRASAVFVYLMEAIASFVGTPEPQLELPVNTDAVRGLGEPASYYPHTQSDFGTDFPLDRRVEVVYLITKAFENPTIITNEPCSDMWKIGFDENLSGGGEAAPHQVLKSRVSCQW